MIMLIKVAAFLALPFLPSQSAPAEGELFLTPLIKAGELDKARAQAEDNFKLSDIKTDKEIKSYSGYFTLEDAQKSNLFFWFFPAQENPEKAPMILWVNELPGFSSMQGVFTETGPFLVDEAGNVKERNVSWTKTHSMLYIDSPAGTGFSFAEKEDVGANDVEGDEFHECLIQFFTLFPEFQKQDFYMAGENYAASFIPYIIKHIEGENGKEGIMINLKGFIVGSPILDIEQSNRGAALYHLGIIDERQKMELDTTIQNSIQLINDGKIDEGTKLGWSTFLGPDSLLAKFTGFKEFRSALEANLLPQQTNFQKFIASKEAHKYLHVGLHKFVDINFNVFEHFVKEIVASHSTIYEDLLNKGYRVLLYSPQFDIFNTREKTAEVVSKLKWKGADKWKDAPRKIWHVGDDVAGFIQMSDNFAYATVRNAGNFAIMDKPEWVFDMVEKFLYQKEF